MFCSSQSPMRQLAADVLVVAAMLCTFTSAFAQAEAPADNAPIGRLNFAAANLPEANVEVDLSQDMFRALFGIGDAAVAGVADALLEAPKTDDTAKATQVAAQQAQALRQIVNLAGNVINEVHVRVYENLPADSANFAVLSKPFDEQLQAGKWETLARVRKNDEVVRVAAIREEGAVRGIFVVASDGNSLVLANVVCDVSPENVQKLTSAATKIGLENGLAKQIQLKLEPTLMIQNRERATITAPTNPPRPPEPAQR